MATELPRAEISPRNENGTIKFYKNDTFVLTIDFSDLTDQDGEDIVIDPTTDSILIQFYDIRNNLIKEFKFGNVTGGGTITDNTVDLTFDAAVSALFDKGRYYYYGYFTNSERRVTVINRAPMLVE